MTPILKCRSFNFVCPYSLGGETYWINAQLAGSLWPLAVADFYLEHLVISQQEEEGEEEGEHEGEET